MEPGQEKGSSRFDRIPLELVEIMDIDCPRDYLQLVPYGIPEPFTVKEFAKEVHIRASLAQVVLQILAYAGVVERVGKKEMPIFIKYWKETSEMYPQENGKK